MNLYRRQFLQVAADLTATVCCAKTVAPRPAKVIDTHAQVSGLVEGTQCGNGDAPADMELYGPVLETLWKTFGPDRLNYGSHWPVRAGASFWTAPALWRFWFGGRNPKMWGYRTLAESG